MKTPNDVMHSLLGLDDSLPQEALSPDFAERILSKALAGADPPGPSYPPCPSRPPKEDAEQADDWVDALVDEVLRDSSPEALNRSSLQIVAPPSTPAESDAPQNTGCARPSAARWLFHASLVAVAVAVVLVVGALGVADGLAAPASNRAATGFPHVIVAIGHAPPAAPAEPSPMAVDATRSLALSADLEGTKLDCVAVRASLKAAPGPDAVLCSAPSVTETVAERKWMLGEVARLQKALAEAPEVFLSLSGTMFDANFEVSARPATVTAVRALTTDEDRPDAAADALFSNQGRGPAHVACGSGLEDVRGD
ncbi:MAG: hypothetical protein RIF41_24835 [Polyangiaceae bacterium]